MEEYRRWEDNIEIDLKEIGVKVEFILIRIGIIFLHIKVIVTNML